MGHRDDERNRRMEPHDLGYRYSHVPGQRWSSGYGGDHVRPHDGRMRDLPPGHGFNGNDFGGGTDLGMGAPPEERGPHYGKGPKGYKRSDARTREEVCEAIAHQGHIDASDVEVVVEGGVVTLSGTVAHRHQKRGLEDLVERIRGVDEVHNLLRLTREEPSRRESPLTSTTREPTTAMRDGAPKNGKAAH